MGSAVRQFEKGVSFRLGTGELLSHCHFYKKASDRLALQKLATAVLLNLAPKIRLRVH